MKTFKVLPALLSYPTVGLVAARSELISVLEDEGSVTGDPLEGLVALIDPNGGNSTAGAFNINRPCPYLGAT